MVKHLVSETMTTTRMTTAKLLKQKLMQKQKPKQQLPPPSTQETPQTPLTTILVRQNTRLDEPSHARARGIELRLVSISFNLADVQPSNQWDQAASFLRFESSMALEEPPVLSFVLKSENKQLNYVHFNVTIDAGKPWGSMLRVMDAPVRQEEVSYSKHVVTCLPPSQLKMEFSMRRDIFDGQSRILVSINISGKPIPVRTNPPASNCLQSPSSTPT